MIRIIGWYRYVWNNDIALYEAQGWSVIDILDEYSVLMKYDG